MHLIKNETFDKSVTFVYIKPLATKIINSTASVFPVFKNMFGELNSFFESVANEF
jgi:membrane protein required for colicin V production